LQKRHLVLMGETGREMAAEFCLSVSLSYLKVSLTCCENLWHETDSFTFPLKEVVLRIFIALKSPLLPAMFEPANLGSNGKNDNL
jgi:hypothetical protein